MRVLHVGKFFPPYAGGIEHFLADLLPALERQGIRTAALVHDHDQGLFGREPPAAGLGRHSEPWIYRAPCYGRLLYAPISPTFPLWLKRAIRDFAPDILHLHVPNTSAFWAMLVPGARRLPWVIHWHADVVPSELDRRLAPAYRLYRPIEQRLLASSGAIVATSPDYLASSEPLRGWRSKSHVIPLGLDPQRIREPDGEALARAGRLWRGSSFKVLAVGRLTYYKGHEVLIQAAAELRDVQVAIVGKGEHRSRLVSLTRALGLADRVTLLGFQAEAGLNALFATCDVVCLPSLERTEAFGLVLLEAMRFGKPVVATDIPGSGVGWVVRQGGHGMLVPPGDPGALSRALRALAEDPVRQEELGQTGERRLQQLFHIERVAEQIGALYRSVIGLKEV